jgi:hypothetical protein
VADGRAAHQQTVIAQDEIVFVAEIAHQPLALVEILRLALEIVIGEPPVKPRRLLEPGLASCRAAWIAEWMTKPAGLMT